MISTEPSSCSSALAQSPRFANPRPMFARAVDTAWGSPIVRAKGIPELAFHAAEGAEGFALDLRRLHRGGVARGLLQDDPRLLVRAEPVLDPTELDAGPQSFQLPARCADPLEGRPGLGEFSEEHLRLHEDAVQAGAPWDPDQRRLQVSRAGTPRKTGSDFHEPDPRRVTVARLAPMVRFLEAVRSELPVGRGPCVRVPPRCD